MTRKIKKQTPQKIVRKFKQYLISTAACDAGTVLMPGEAPGVFAVQELTYKMRTDQDPATMFWAREILDREQEFLESQCRVETKEIKRRPR